MKKLSFLLMVLFFISGCDNINQNLVDLDISLDPLDPESSLQHEMTINLDQSGMVSDILVWNESIILADSRSGKVIFLDKSGNLEKEVDQNTINQIGFSPTALSIDNNVLFIADSFNASIIEYDLLTDEITLKSIAHIIDFPFNSILSILKINDDLYFSAFSNQGGKNNLYRIDKNNKLNTVMNNFTGHINLIDNKILLSNAHKFNENKGVFEYITGNSKLIELDIDHKIQQEFKLEDKLSPYRLIKHGDFLFSSCLGNASIVEYDLKNKKSKVVYSIPITESKEVMIGPLAIDNNGKFYIIDNFQHTLEILVSHDRKEFNEF